MSDNYEVGRGKPPKHTQFKKGQTGNSKGRPKKSRNFSSDLGEVLKQTVVIHEKGQKKSVSTQLAALMRLLEKALKGDQRALERFLTMAAEYSAETEAKQAERAISQSEADILSSYEEMIRKGARSSIDPIEDVDK